jgi:hypothetical protein
MVAVVAVMVAGVVATVAAVVAVVPAPVVAPAVAVPVAACRLGAWVGLAAASETNTRAKRTIMPIEIPPRTVERRIHYSFHRKAKQWHIYRSSRRP